MAELKQNSRYVFEDVMILEHDVKSILHNTPFFKKLLPEVVLPYIQGMCAWPLLTTTMNFFFIELNKSS